MSTNFTERYTMTKCRCIYIIVELETEIVTIISNKLICKVGYIDSMNHATSSVDSSSISRCEVFPARFILLTGIAYISRSIQDLL